MRNLKKMVSIFVLGFASLYSVDFQKGISSYASTNFSDPIRKTKLDVASCIVAPIGLSSAIFSPGFAAYANGNFDLSFGIGIRKRFLKKDLVLGHHYFVDYCIQQPFSFSQFGLSLEAMTKKLDLRLNYYHPLKISESNAQKWVELEGILKFPKFCVGLVPFYNCATKKFAVKPKLIFPFEVITLEIGAIISQNSKETSSYIGVGIPIYNVGHKTVSRSSSVKYSRAENFYSKKKSY